MLVAAVMLLGVQVQQAQATRACCRVFANGVARTSAFGSFNCNTSGFETRRISTGRYEVDFLFSDVRFLAKSATLDTQGPGETTGQIGVADRANDLSSVWVVTTDSGGFLADRAFDVCVH